MAESAKILKEEYKALRKHAASTTTAYRITVRQLESLVRLSEAMARLHCDDKIRPAYVQEVCRLLRTSNINIIKSDVELEENQDNLNKVREERILEDQAGNDLFAYDAEKRQHSVPQTQGQAQTSTKVKITYDEY
jgi:DNA replication licensing factor MCM6